LFAGGEAEYPAIRSAPGPAIQLEPEIVFELDSLQDEFSTEQIGHGAIPAVRFGFESESELDGYVGIGQHMGCESDLAGGNAPGLRAGGLEDVFVLVPGEHCRAAWDTGPSTGHFPAWLVYGHRPGGTEREHH